MGVPYDGEWLPGADRAEYGHDGDWTAPLDRNELADDGRTSGLQT